MSAASYIIGKEILGLLEAQKEYAATVTKTTRQHTVARLYASNMLLKNHRLIWSTPTGGIQVGLKLAGTSNTEEAPIPVLIPANLLNNMVKDSQLYRSGDRRNAALTLSVVDGQQVSLSGITKSGESLSSIDFDGQRGSVDAYIDLCGLWQDECEATGQSGTDRRLHFNVNAKRMALYLNALVRSGCHEVVMSAPPMYLDDEKVDSNMVHTWTIMGRVHGASPRSPFLAIVAGPAVSIRSNS